MSEDKYQGCGISSLWATSEKDPLKPACDWHDGAYEQGSWSQANLTRKQTDDKFLEYMLGCAKGNKALIARAYCYYGIVRLLGGKWWEGKK